MNTENTTEAADTAQGDTGDDLLHGGDRVEAISGMRALLDILEADPTIPIDSLGFKLTVFAGSAGIAEGNTAEAVCWLGTVAGAIDVEVTDHVGRTPSESTTIYKAIRSFGERAVYEATFIAPEFYEKRAAAAAAGGGDR
jgi:hypothetical protein